MSGPELPGLRIEEHGAVRRVVIDRADALNAVDADLHTSLAEVWAVLAADPDARAVVLTGAGEAFSAGGDLGWIASFPTDHEARDRSLVEARQIIEAMVACPLPVVAAVNGPAVGLGCSMAILCDVVLIADDAHLADPHVAAGLTAGDGGAAFWPLLTPLLRSREFLLTGDPIDADTAVSLGLASRVVPVDALTDEALALATRLARLPAEAVQSTKAVLNMVFDRAVHEVVPVGLAHEAATMTSPDHLRIIDKLRPRGGS